MKNKIIPIMFLYLFASSTNASYKMLFENNVIKLPEKSIENSIESNEFFQHLRIQILDNNGDPNYVSLGDINWIIESNSYPSEVLTGYTNSPSPYKVTDSGVLGNNPEVYGGWHLYDDVSDGHYVRWLGSAQNFPHEIDIDLGQVFNVSSLESIQITPASHYIDDPKSRSVSHFKVFVSEDGINWVEKLEINNIQPSEWQENVKNNYQF
jgi:hypothetical protein